MLVKISILVMYTRIFVFRSFRIGAWILSALTIVWSVVCWLPYVLQCTPIEHLWDPSVPGKCINVKGMCTMTAMHFPISNCCQLYISVVP